MKERLLAMRPLLLRVIGYPLFFLLCFVVFLYITFPYDRLKEVIIAQAEAPRVSPSGRTLPSNMELTIASLGPTFFPGLKAKGVTVTYLPSSPGGRPTFMHIDEAVVHVSLLGLLLRRANVSFDIEGLGGEIEGSLSWSLATETAADASSSSSSSSSSSRRAAAGTPSGLRSFEMKITGVNAAEMGPLVQAVGLPLGGTLDGTIELTVPDGQIPQAEGAVAITASHFAVGDGHAQYQIPHFGGVTIDQIRAGDFTFNMNIRRGVATLERVGAQSNEFALQMDGRVDLRPELSLSAMNLGIHFKLTDAYRAKSEQAGRILTVMEMVPDLQRARRADGMYGFRCTGVFARPPTCLPDARGAAGAPGGAMGAAGRVDE
ncbi:MAG: type II secretion system protein GspN [Polyangiales bacterium]